MMRRIQSAAILGASLVLASSQVVASDVPTSEAAAKASAATTTPSAEVKYPRMVVLGIDGMDPEILAEAIALYPERMKNFKRLAEEGGINSLGTSVPPQSPVAWSNFITGRNPGGHGIYDFIRADRTTRAAMPGNAIIEDADNLPLWGDWQLPLSGGSESLRTGESFWVTLANHGVPADIWRMPANFPVEPAEGLSFPGMMTPALDSAYGVFKVFSTDPPIDFSSTNGKYIQVRELNGVIRTSIEGPPNSYKVGNPPVSTELTFYLDHDSNAVAIEGNGQVIVLEPGEWSDFMTLEWAPVPMGAQNQTGIVRFYLRSMAPEFEMYASPVNIDPMDSAAGVSEPPEAAVELAESIGMYYTQGMAEEVNGLKSGVLSDTEFMDQTKLIYNQRVNMMDYALDKYLEKDGGFFFFYYSTVDLNCHMMWRFHDEDHPQYEQIAELAEEDSSEWSGRDGSKWKEVIYDLYLLMDPVLGKVRERVGDDATIVVMSDHGFAPYRRKFSLNRWLYEEGYLVFRDDFGPELERSDPKYKQVPIYSGHGQPSTIDWTKTRAYGMGFNGLYLNAKGRELDDPETLEVDESGIVNLGAEGDALLAEIKAKLEAIRDEDGTQVILTADLAKDVYVGERVAEAPDIQVGYNAGYGNSDASSLGRVPSYVLTDNIGGTFNGNHLMAPEVVAGILLTNGQVLPGAHALEDLTVDILKHYGIQPGEGQNGHPVLK
jgi:predicted AlkP superfamily phosphohydrolase/phosphomutase